MTKPVIGMALSAVLAAWWLPIFALAQTGGVGVIPKPVEGQPPRSWFVHTLRPGESTTDTLVINNNSPRTKSVVVEALDAVNTTEGGYTLVKTAADNREVGSWIKLEQTNLILAPNTSAEVPFTITVPGDTGPGQHSGGIVIYERAGGQAGGNINFQIRVGARVYITVPGEITRKLSFDKVDYKIDKSGLTFNITAKNESNINIEPALDIKLQGIFGSRTEEMNENGTYLPGSVMNITKVWDRPAPKFGYYRIAVVAHTWTVDEVQLDGTVKKLPDERFEYKFSFWVGTKYLGWWLLGLGLAWLKYRWWVWWLDRRKYRLKTITHTVQKGETVMHIAEHTNVLPQQLIRFNQLTWPHAINAGDKLFIPVGLLSPSELSEKRRREPMPAWWRYLVSGRTSLYRPGGRK